MHFLTIDDYKPFVQDAVLQQVIQGDSGTLLTAGLMAQAEMTGYLKTRFDCAAIFAATGQARNQAVVMCFIDITLYHLHSRVSPRNVSQLRADRYKAAIEWLKMAAFGEIQPDLPLKTDERGHPDNRLKYGSNPKPDLRY
ncbi:MAG TPA: phage protein Gp36 family protein [Dissulfurispiraceae bacterium]|nr:phage protein Gp36 family protein [Dissulfurispiraceae bacterium]